jgi:hypothetical protein
MSNNDEIINNLNKALNSTRRKNRSVSSGPNGPNGSNGSNTGILKQILEVVKNISVDVSGLKVDISGLKADVSILKVDVSGLNTRLTKLEGSVTQLRVEFNGLRKEFNGYTKKESDDQESRLLNIIYNKLRTQSTYNFEIMDNVKNFYTRDSPTPFTEFDGAIYMTNKAYQTKMNHSNIIYQGALSKVSDINRFIPDPSFNLFKVARLIIIESKHSTDIMKVFYKLRQVYKINEIIHYIPTSKEYNIASEGYKEQYKNFIEDNDIEDTGIIFASDRIDSSIMNLLNHINDGTLTEEILSSVLFRAFINDGRFKKLIGDNDIDHHIRNKVRTATMLKDACSVKIVKYSDFLNDYCIDYNKNMWLFDYFKGKIGYYDGKVFKFGKMWVDSVSFREGAS